MSSEVDMHIAQAADILGTGLVAGAFVVGLSRFTLQLRSSKRRRT
jgi:hypothetical protein